MDTSLISLYTPDANSITAVEIMQGFNNSHLVSTFAELEAVNALELRVFEKRFRLSRQSLLCVISEGFKRTRVSTRPITGGRLRTSAADLPPNNRAPWYAHGGPIARRRRSGAKCRFPLHLRSPTAQARANSSVEDELTGFDPKELLHVRARSPHLRDTQKYRGVERHV